MKERLDVLLVKRNLAESREKAKAIIMSGNVFVDGEREDKAGTSFPDDVSIEIKGHTLPYVSRGGLKLEKKQSRILTCRWKARCVRMWDPRPEDLRTVCCRMELSRYLLLMLDVDSLHGS